MDILAPKMDKSLPFEKVQPQWQLLYLFFWECTKSPHHTEIITSYTSWYYLPWSDTSMIFLKY